MVVHHGGEQVIGGGDGVEVPGEVEVDILHGHYLGVAAAGGTALDAEYGAQGGLPQGDDGLFAQPAQCVAQAHGGGGLSLPGGGGVDGRDQNQLSIWTGGLTQQAMVHLGLVPAVKFQIRAVHAGRFRDLGDGAQLAGLCDLNIRGNAQHIVSTLALIFLRPNGAI